MRNAAHAIRLSEFASFDEGTKLRDVRQSPITESGPIQFVTVLSGRLPFKQSNCRGFLPHKPSGLTLPDIGNLGAFVGSAFFENYN